MVLRLRSTSETNITSTKASVRNDGVCSRQRRSSEYEEKENNKSTVSSSSGLLNAVRRVLSSFKINSKDAVQNVDEHMEWDPVVPWPQFRELVDFTPLFGECNYLNHPDFDNDICNYFHHNQASYPLQLRGKWELIGDKTVLPRTMSYLCELADMSPMPTEALHLASYYVHYAIAYDNILINELEDLCVSALRLASKIERQGCRASKKFATGFATDKLNAMERRILRAIDFRCEPTTVIAFMRLLTSVSHDRSWQWGVAKSLAQLAICQHDLSSTTSSLLAAVIMRLTCQLNGKDWKPVHYELAQHSKEEMAEPHAILCRLILVARRNLPIYVFLSNSGDVLQRVISLSYDWLLNEASPAVPHYIYGINNI